MKCAVIAITESARITSAFIEENLPVCRLYFHKEKGWLTSNISRLFREYEGLIFIMAAGIVVRMIAPYVESKFRDPAVVVVDDACRYAISLLSGHEGGANVLTSRIATLLNAIPVITTSSDAHRDIIAGIGCRRNTPAHEIEAAVASCLKKHGIGWDHVRTAATIELKQNEPGLLELFFTKGIPVCFFSIEDINNFDGPYDISQTAVNRLGVKAVAAPCALMAGYKAELIQPKKVIGNVTVALAREKPRPHIPVPDKRNTIDGGEI